MREARGGRIVQLSSYGGQVAFPGNSLYHATKFGIEGFCESVAQEVAPFGIGVTIVEPGGARTEFRYGSAQVADPLPGYVGTPARSFEKMLDPANGLAVGDPARMATAIIDSVDQQPGAACGWCSARRPSKAPSARYASGSPTSKRRRNWPPPPTTRPANRPAKTKGFDMKHALLGDLDGLPNRAGRHGHVPRLHRRRIRRRRIDPHHPPCPRPRRHPHRHRRDLRSVHQRRTRRPGHQGPS